MAQVKVTLEISSPVEKVFDTVAHIENFKKAVPHILEVEYLTDSTRGEGTRFRETRLMGKRRASTELHVAEYVPNERVRMVSDQGGTVWDSLFETTATSETTTRLDMVMDARPHTLLAKITVPLIRNMVQKAVEADMNAIKTYCENS